MTDSGSTDHSAPPGTPPSAGHKPERDLVALGIIVAAGIMLIGHAGAALPAIWRYAADGGDGPAEWLASALLLNIAIIVFGWRRYRELIREVNRRRTAEQAALQLALTDPLTGSLNRRSIIPETDRIVDSARIGGRAVAFIMVDLDNFKQINDLNGHRAGDSMLVEVARRIADQLPEAARMARLGGDEFACVLEYDPMRPDTVDQVATAILECTRKPVVVAGGELCVSLSLGIASASLADDEPSAANELLHMADMAMYHAKKAGRNRYDWFSPAMERQLRLKSELENGVRLGIARGEFVPYYEQQVDMDTGELTGFEMLARWQSPSLGLVMPETFIPVAEEIGLIGDLSESVMAQAMRDAREWDPKLTLSVNISPLQMRDPWFAQKLLKLTAEANFPPERLEIEITESCLHENIGLVRSLITSLKNQGVSISLDDFGTGYASIAQLKALPFDRIKIDRSFISELGKGYENDAIVSAINSIGEGLKLPLTAEGVENESVRDSLRRMGNFKAQGYFYGRPEPAEQVRARLRSEARLAGDGETRKAPVGEAGPEEAKVVGC